jgi:hypothetical protein
MALLPGYKAELDLAMRDYNQAFDAGLTALRSGTGKLGTRSNGSDTTAQGGYEFHRLQGASRFAAKLIMDAELDLMRAIQRLERAGSAIHNGWLDTDPDIGMERRERRSAATQGTQESLTLDTPPATLRRAGADDGR